MRLNLYKYLINVILLCLFITNGRAQLAPNVHVGTVADTIFKGPWEYRFPKATFPSVRCDECIISNEKEYQEKMSRPSDNIDWEKYTLVGMFCDASSQDPVSCWIDYIACHEKGKDCQNHYIVRAVRYSNGWAMAEKIAMNWYLIPRLQERETVKFFKKTYPISKYGKK